MNKFKLSLGVLLVAVLSFTSCKKDEIIDTTTENYKGVFVINEGGFNKSNGSIGLFKPGTKAYFDAFKKANNRPLGDIVQSMSLINSNYYIVVNNSNKIEVVSQNKFQSVASISTASPRYVLKVGDNKAYITNLYNNTVKVLNLGNNQIESNIDVKASSNALALLDTLVYIATNDKLVVVNPKTDAVQDSIVTTSGLSKVVNFGSKLAVLCTGSVDWNTGSVTENGNIYFINKDSAAIEKTFPLSTGSYGGSMVYNSVDGLLYFSLGDNKIQTMSSSGTIKDFVTLSGTGMVYGLSVGLAGEIYVTDAGNFSEAGKVYVYDNDGTKAYDFTAGIAPNAVVINQ